MSGGAAPLDGLRHMALKTTTPENAPARFRICTDDFPPRERALAWRELYGRSVLRLEIEPLSDAPFSSELLISQMPDLGVARGHASPFRVGRTRELLTDGDDGLIFQITDVAGRAAQLGHDVDVAANEAVLLSCADIGSFTFPASCKVLALRLRRAALAPLVRNVDAMLVRPVPAQNEALRLLTRYIGVLDEAPPASAAVARLATTHIYDLAALALGPREDAAELGRSRGVRAARRRTIEAYIGDNLHRAELSLGDVAARHGIAPRTLQALFEAEGTSFTRFLLEQRLLRAYRLLTGPSARRRGITAIAYECGFNDLSYFNRSFRRHFGLTPSEARAGKP
jgi:AraC-like DNA-binding protein